MRGKSRSVMVIETCLLVRPDRGELRVHYISLNLQNKLFRRVVGVSAGMDERQSRGIFVLDDLRDGVHCCGLCNGFM